MCKAKFFDLKFVLFAIAAIKSDRIIAIVGEVKFSNNISIFDNIESITDKVIRFYLDFISANFYGGVSKTPWLKLGGKYFFMALIERKSSGQILPFYTVGQSP